MPRERSKKPRSPRARVGALRVDGRRPEATRFRRLKEELTAEIGGKPTASEKALIERAALQMVMLERLDAAGLRGERVDPLAYAKLSDGVVRLLRYLRAKPAGQSKAKPARATGIDAHAAAVREASR